MKAHQMPDLLWRCSPARPWRRNGRSPTIRSRSACWRLSKAPFTVLGQDGVRGAELAFKEANYTAGGKKIEVIKGSSDASPDSAVKAARKLVEQDGVQDPDRAAVGRRRSRGQGLREDPAERHLHQWHIGRAGHHVARSRRRTSTASPPTARNGWPASATTPTRTRNTTPS